MGEEVFRRQGCHCRAYLSSLLVCGGVQQGEDGGPWSVVTGQQCPGRSAGSGQGRGNTGAKTGGVVSACQHTDQPPHRHKIEIETYWCNHFSITVPLSISIKLCLIKLREILSFDRPESWRVFALEDIFINLLLQGKYFVYFQFELLKLKCFNLIANWFSK